MFKAKSTKYQPSNKSPALYNLAWTGLQRAERRAHFSEKIKKTMHFSLRLKQPCLYTSQSVLLNKKNKERDWLQLS